MDEIVESKNRFNIRKILAELFAIFIWLFFSIKLFLFDLDVYIFQKIDPSYYWILRYKFFFIVIIFIIIAFAFKKRKFQLFTFFVLGYPLILLFWRIPKTLFKTKNWIGVFAAIGISVSFFKSFKQNIILFSLVSISFVLIIVHKSIYFLGSSIFILLTFLILHYIKRFYLSFKPYNIFSMQPVLNELMIYIQNHFKISEKTIETNIDDL